MTLLAFEQVTKRYHDGGGRQRAVLDGVSFELADGDAVGLWGTRRSGKSTLLRLAAGLEQPDDGVVRFEGRDVARLSRGQRSRLLRKRIGLAPASWQATRNERVVDHVALPILSTGASLHQAGFVARETLERVGAIGRADDHVGELSAGERTRVAIARALVRDPALLLVDEPAMTPSPGERDELAALLRTLMGEPGLTVIAASEDLAVVRAAHRMMTIGDGAVRSSERSAHVVPFPDGRAERARQGRAT
jgi:ABC-type lipoprotein export system ATPase subunit